MKYQKRHILSPELWIMIIYPTIGIPIPKRLQNERKWRIKNKKLLAGSLEYKCENCKSRATPTMDGPYGGMEHCAKGHWEGRGMDPEPKEDPRKDCEDYEEEDETNSDTNG